MQSHYTKKMRRTYRNKKYAIITKLATVHWTKNIYLCHDIPWMGSHIHIDSLQGLAEWLHLQKYAHKSMNFKSLSSPAHRLFSHQEQPARSNVICNPRCLKMRIIYRNIKYAIITKLTTVHWTKIYTCAMIFHDWEVISTLTVCRV